MKIQNEYPNFNKALQFLISDKNPVLVSNDSKKLSYYIPLRNFKKGFDYYELTRVKDKGVYFSLVTMVGFKTIIETNSTAFTNDISENEWTDILFKKSMEHFAREEYQALKKGYVKKKSGGCLVSFLIILFGIVSVGILNYYK